MAPESAITDLRRRAGAAGAAPETSGIPNVELGGRLVLERNLLVEWARENNLMLPADEYLSRIEDTHGEHHVYYDTTRERYFKITHGSDGASAGFALTVATNFHIGKKTQRYIAVPFLREATPFEYISRLRLFNLTFGDEIEIEGVIAEPGKEAIVISQPFIEGEAATAAQVDEFMAELGFVPVPGVSAGKGKTVSYFRASDSVAVFDTHGQNFLISGSEIVPIDGLIIVANKDLATYLTMPADERVAELGH